MNTKDLYNTTRYFRIDAPISYWEDADINGVEDNHDEPTMPFAVPVDNKWEHCYKWLITIDITTGNIVGWPKGTVAHTNYKVCDNGTYSLLNSDNELLITVSSYVPSFIDYYGDYLEFDIDENGHIKDFKMTEEDVSEMIENSF